MSKVPTSSSDFLSAASSPMFVVDALGAVQWTNDAARALLGNAHSLSQVVGVACARDILSSVGARSFHVGVGPQRKACSLTAVDCSGSDPGDTYFLLSLSFSESADQQMQAREDALVTVAHDLKNPLAAIFGYSDTLLDTTVGATLDTPQREIVKRIRRTASRAVELVRNYQALAQLRHHLKLIQSEATDLNAVVRGLVDSTWREDPNSPAVVVSLPSNPVMVCAEKIWLERLIANLFNNALSYSDPMSPVRVDVTAAPSRAALSINNHGPIIPADELSSLFDRFQRASSSKGTTGTGLGLYIVKLIADSIGATVRVESNATEGTTVTVSLPLNAR